jgi:opacity protein-like surface antigen
MKKITLVLLAWFGIGMTMNAVAGEGSVFSGFSLDSAQSTENGVKNSSFGFTGLASFRPNEYYGVELQGGYLGKSGPFTTNVEVDLSAVGLLPLGDSGFKLYGKAGVADVYSSLSAVTANNLGLTYGAGVEFQRNKGAIRLGFQHFNVGNNTLSPSLSTNLIGITFMSKTQ